MLIILAILFLLGIAWMIVCRVARTVKQHEQARDQMHERYEQVFTPKNNGDTAWKQ